MTKVIVIGISAGGISAISKIKQLDIEKNFDITAISYEEELPYNKCLLADYLSGGKLESEVYIRNKNFFEDNNINLILGKRVIKILPQENKILLSSSEYLDYDILIVATGLQPYVPKVSSANTDHIFIFNSIADARKIKNFVLQNNPKKALIIGGGLTGVEVADSLWRLNIKLSIELVDSGSSILSRHLDSKGSKYLYNLMINKGIKIKFNTLVEIDSIYKDYDLIILAIGAKLDTLFFENSGISLSRNSDNLINGVIVNEFMQIPDYKNIYCVGDICRIKDLLNDDFIQSTTWPDAVMQGMIAGMNIAGKQTVYNGALVICNSHFFEKDFFSAGNFSTLYKDSSFVGGPNFILESENSLGVVKIDSEGYIKAFYSIGSSLYISHIKPYVLFKKPIDEDFLKKVWAEYPK